jgi:Tat protein secretion system quality control protein TatD with DNase activity
MISIRDFVFNNLKLSDSHINLFGDSIYSDYSDFDILNSIVMCNISLDEENKSVLKTFDLFLSKDENKQYIISANGKDIDEIKTIIEKYKNQIKCIGEIKCYKHCINSKGEELESEDFSIPMNLDFTDLPVFIHCDLINDRIVNTFEQVLKKNLNKKVVLCHCGINDLDNQEKSFKYAVDLQHKYNNLWFEISWKAYDYINTDNRKLSQLDTDRIVLGTDLTIYDENVEEILRLFKYWNNQIRNKTNIKKLLSN